MLEQQTTVEKHDKGSVLNLINDLEAKAKEDLIEEKLIEQHKQWHKRILAFIAIMFVLSGLGVFLCDQLDLQIFSFVLFLIGIILLFLWECRFYKLIIQKRDALKPWEKKKIDAFAFLLDVETSLYKAK